MDQARLSDEADGARGVLEAAAAAVRAGRPAVLAVVVGTEGSTYVGVGGMALFGGAGGQVGWLSGGCLEPEIERQARRAADSASLGWLEIDTRDDEDLLSGSALGCRGRLRLALLPLQALTGVETILQAWLQMDAPLWIEVRADGGVVVGLDGDQHVWRLAGDAPTWAAGVGPIRIAALPTVIVFGAGPETPLLLPLLRETGWRSVLVERRPRWTSLAEPADRHIDAAPAAAVAAAGRQDFAAALVMHHNFELDREALSALSSTAIPFVGLLGPVRRREDLFRLLPEAQRQALLPRLHSPIGLKLGGRGPQAIALSIAAQLHAFRHGEDPR